MSMPTSTPSPSPPSYPEISRSDLEAVRRFLTSHRDDERRARPINVLGNPNGPTLRHGIARARLRSAARPAD
jgi:hypothetical protein